MVEHLGDQQLILRVEVTDTRDGRLIWADGRQLSPADHADTAVQMLLNVFDAEQLPQEDRHGGEENQDRRTGMGAPGPPS